MTPGTTDFSIGSGSHSLVHGDQPPAGWTVVLHVFTGINTEWDTAAKETPKQSEAAKNEPGHEAGGVLYVGDHSLLAVWTQDLPGDLPQGW